VVPQHPTPNTINLGSVTGGAADQAGNLYIPLFAYHVVVKLDTSGAVTAVAGNWTPGYGGDTGPATSAQLDSPSALAIDSAGHLYIADMGNNVIRRIVNGTIFTVAGGGSSYDEGAPATSAHLYRPAGIVLDGADNLYIADTGDDVVRVVQGGRIYTLAGNWYPGYSGDNVLAWSTKLNRPLGLALDSAGNLYIADAANNRIRKVSLSTQIITTVAGTETQGYNGDGIAATSAQLSFPINMALDAAGNLYIADTYNDRIRRVSSGVINTVAGTGVRGYNGDNIQAAAAQLNAPAYVALGAAGDLYILDSGNNRVRIVSAGIITTLAGGTSQLGDGGPATNALLSWGQGVAVDAAGNVYIADTGANRLRKVSHTNGFIPRWRAAAPRWATPDWPPAPC
jgi:sugar lactone lactonase YvrE